MELRTIINPARSADTIGYNTPVMLTGSCFSNEMGEMFEAGRMNVMVNPFGVLYNPVSVARQIEVILSGTTYSAGDLEFFDNRYLSFDHDTGFSSADRDKCLSMINETTRQSHQFLSTADFLFVTFGTARIFRHAVDGRVVANCHKMPASRFTRELLTVDKVVDEWSNLVGELRKFNSRLKVCFTVSPVRHWKDGAHGNQVSKSVLLLAIEQLVNNIDSVTYFPSYELLLDDLRDYRFYADDLLHPGSLAIGYIRKYFQEVYFDEQTKKIYNEVVKVTGATRHRVMSSDDDDRKRFAETMISKISDLLARHPFLNLEEELVYFNRLMSGLTE
ncbi:MAG: GSCFA domain-containing protein [Bacteroidales bacterium]